MPLPRSCPKCKSIRWNQRYLDEELALIDRLQEKLYETGLIRESGEKIVFEGNETLGTKPRTISPYDYDFISYFLKQILPQPELFELSCCCCCNFKRLHTHKLCFFSLVCF